MRCDGCAAEDYEELTCVCTRCGYTVCEDCEVKQSRGICPCGAMRHSMRHSGSKDVNATSARRRRRSCSMLLRLFCPLSARNILKRAATRRVRRVKKLRKKKQRRAEALEKAALQRMKLLEAQLLEAEQKRRRDAWDAAMDEAGRMCMDGTNGLLRLVEHYHAQADPRVLMVIETLSRELCVAVRSDERAWLSREHPTHCDVTTRKVLCRTVRGSILSPTSSDDALILRLFPGTLGFGEMGRRFMACPLAHLDSSSLDQLLRGRRAMLCHDGRLVTDAEMDMPRVPFMGDPTGLSFMLDVHSLPAEASQQATFERRLSSPMLWMHHADRLEVENYDELPDWGGGCGSHDELEDGAPWSSDETYYDELAACNFCAGRPGRRTLELLVREDESYLLEIKSLEIKPLFLPPHSAMTRHLAEGLFFSSRVPGRVLHELYEKGDCYHGRALISPGYAGARNVKLYDYWRQNVHRCELAQLPSHLEGWASVPGIKYTVLVAGLRKDNSGRLFLEDVHMSFASNSGMGQGVFEESECWMQKSC
jgi:hypothetical protein